MSDDVFNATLIEREDLTDELSIVRVRPDGGPVPEFLPGQFIKLGLPRDEAESAATAEATGRVRPGPRLVRRAYSIASSPRVRDHVELLVVRVETGKLTPKLWDIAPGGRLWMEEQAAGRFTLDRIPRGVHLVMVATGTGVAPYASMLRTFQNDPPWRSAVLMNGVRYAGDLAYREEFEGLAHSDPLFRYLPIVSREPGGAAWAGLRGRVQSILAPQTYESLAGHALDPRTCHVMLCGNPGMIISVQALLEERGFRTHEPGQPGNIHFERYW